MSRVRVCTACGVRTTDCVRDHAIGSRCHRHTPPCVTDLPIGDRATEHYRANPLARALHQWNGVTPLTSWVALMATAAASTAEPIPETSSYRPARWPILSENGVPRLSSTFGPRLKASEGYRYDFHRGIDIPTPVGTPVVAISDGVIRIAGEHDAYSDPLVQIRHTRPGAAECRGSEEGCYYSNYLHLASWAVTPGQTVRAGDVIGTTGASESGFPHLHFEIRDGGVWQKHAVHPLTVLPYDDASSPVVHVADTHLHNGKLSVTVGVRIDPRELDLEGVALAVLGRDGRPLQAREFRFADFNASNTPKANPNRYADDPQFGGREVRPGIYRASSPSYELQITFTDLDSHTSATELRVQAVDVAGNQSAAVRHIGSQVDLHST